MAESKEHTFKMVILRCSEWRVRISSAPSVLVGLKFCRFGCDEATAPTQTSVLFHFVPLE